MNTGVEISDKVLTEYEELLQMLRKKRKLNNTHFQYIDVDSTITQMQEASVTQIAQKVPMDVLRYLFKVGLSAKNYYRIATKLNKKFHDWVKQDVIILKIERENYQGRMVFDNFAFYRFTKTARVQLLRKRSKFNRIYRDEWWGTIKHNDIVVYCYEPKIEGLMVHGLWRKFTNLKPKLYSQAGMGSKEYAIELKFTNQFWQNI